jgi:hypothetical protein
MQIESGFASTNRVSSVAAFTEKRKYTPRHGQRWNDPFSFAVVDCLIITEELS